MFYADEVTREQVVMNKGAKCCFNWFPNVVCRQARGGVERVRGAGQRAARARGADAPAAGGQDGARRRQDLLERPHRLARDTGIQNLNSLFY